METQAYFQDIQKHIQTHLTSAQSSIDLAVAWFTDRLLFDLLCKKAKRGVSVRLLFYDDDINERYLPFETLTQAGAKVFRINEKLMHNKFCVIDREVVITGSYNWTNRANNDNLENITVTTGDSFFALQFVQELNRILEQYCHEKQEITTDFSQIVKRLELIRQLIELGDTDDLPPQYRKLKNLNLPSDIATILNLLDAQRYGDAVAHITDFIARFRQVATYIDPELAALKLEMHAIELDISGLENEKAEAEKTIQDFEIQYNRALGDLLIEILSLRKQIAQKQAEAKPDDAEAQGRQTETDNDYKSYYKSYEATKAKPLSNLTVDEKQLLKNRFREATKLCHPDVVAEAYKDKAKALFIELRQAYESNDLTKVTDILDYLRTGKPYQAEHTSLNEKRLLRLALERLRQQREQILNALQALKEHESFVLIQNISDWQTYFDNQKVALLERLEKLNATWTRINN
jgi:PLD-like domain